MPVLSIGTGGEERAKAFEIVTSWLDLGGRAIDTALIYRDQQIVAEAINASGVPRKNLFVTTKIPGCGGHEVTKSAVEQDLKLLGTNYIDLLMLHSPRGWDCAGSWQALEQLHGQGALRAIGVSNFQAHDLQKLLATANIMPAVNQIQHNIFQHDDDTIAFLQAHNITLEAYSPLGRNSTPVFSDPRILQIAQTHNVSAAQVALKWILQHGHILTFQSASKEHQANDADLFKFTLTHDDMSVLDNLKSDVIHI